MDNISEDDIQTEDDCAVNEELNGTINPRMQPKKSSKEIRTPLTSEGAQIVLEGSHVARVWAALSAKGDGRPGPCVQERMYRKGGSGLVKLVPSITDTTQLQLREVDPTGMLEAGKKHLAELRKRKLIVQRSLQNTIQLPLHRRASCFMPPRRGAQKTSTFKKYNFEVDSAPTSGGTLRSLLKVREEIRNIFLEMGFEELPMSSFVESGFNALFVPQQHPARELHRLEGLGREWCVGHVAPATADQAEQLVANVVP
ncbi:hypothetical protein BV22DRAFT_1130975 [Leucogyrophana mollusca]|uniref:Uncharacterized protein n=1 Tax=Leucogyrophana mollusca TaxID=85980 RepID=A0ACB8BE76_9AGAM|nr:hypothetical protein BV22DRAFT_1130975 [Leucogyrophana mollusca]